MTERKKFRDLVARMSPAAQEAAKVQAAELRGRMPLAELRQALHLTQQQLASTMEMEQGNLSKLERQTDMYVSTLRRYVEAMGGSLEIVARFPEGAIAISQFGEMAEA
jgi:DNA-binding transcriptional regulator YiaG